jgi:hypothetical protein
MHMPIKVQPKAHKYNYFHIDCYELVGAGPQRGSGVVVIDQEMKRLSMFIAPAYPGNRMKRVDILRVVNARLERRGFRAVHLQEVAYSLSHTEDHQATPLPSMKDAKEDSDGFLTMFPRS